MDSGYTRLSAPPNGGTTKHTVSSSATVADRRRRRRCGSTPKVTRSRFTRETQDDTRSGITESTLAATRLRVHRPAARSEKRRRGPAPTPLGTVLTPRRSDRSEVNSRLRLRSRFRTACLSFRLSAGNAREIAPSFRSRGEHFGVLTISGVTSPFVRICGMIRE